MVSQCLEHCSLSFEESELASPHQNSKTDVHFRGANFQIKEILNPGSRRSAEIKAIYEGLNGATILKDIIGSPFAYDVPSPTTIYLLVADSLEERAEIVCSIEELKSQVSTIESIYERKLTALAELKQSVLQKAFSGELTADKSFASDFLKEEEVA